MSHYREKGLLQSVKNILDFFCNSVSVTVATFQEMQIFIEMEWNFGFDNVSPINRHAVHTCCTKKCQRERERAFVLLCFKFNPFFHY